MTSEERYDSLFQWHAGADDWRRLKAQAIAESNLDPRAVSSCGAQGISQFMPATFREIMREGEDPFNPEASITAQSLYMHRLLKRYHDDWPVALAAYNWGMGNVDRCIKTHGLAWRSHLPTETTQYLARIATIYARLTA